MYAVSMLQLAAARLALSKQAWNAGESMLDDQPISRSPALQQRIMTRQPVAPGGPQLPSVPGSFASHLIRGPYRPESGGLDQHLIRGLYQPEPGGLGPQIVPLQDQAGDSGSYPRVNQLAQMMRGRHGAGSPPVADSPYAGLSPDEQQFVEQQGATPDPVPAPAEPSPYQGLSPEEEQFVAQQGATPDPEPAPTEAPAPASQSMVSLPPPRPGRFQHVIDDTQRMLVGTKQRLAEAQASGNARLASQLQRHVANAEQRIADMQQRQGFGQDEYKGWLAQQGVSSPDQRAEQLFSPGGQMDWYQQAANNQASGRPQYAGISANSPGRPQVPPVTTSGVPASGTGSPSSDPQAPSESAIADHMQRYPYLNRWRANSPLRDGSPQFAAEFPHLNQLNTQHTPELPAPNPQIGSLAAK